MSLFNTNKNTIKTTKTFLSSPIYQWTGKFGTPVVEETGSYSFYASALAEILENYPRHAHA